MAETDGNSSSGPDVAAGQRIQLGGTAQRAQKMAAVDVAKGQRPIDGSRPSSAPDLVPPPAAFPPTPAQSREMPPAQVTPPAQAQQSPPTADQ
jgi:hypothetical protein